MSKIIEIGPEARKKLTQGVDKMADAVVATLGPNGRNVVISRPNDYPQSTKDGVGLSGEEGVGHGGVWLGWETTEER